MLLATLFNLDQPRYDSEILLLFAVEFRRINPRSVDSLEIKWFDLQGVEHSCGALCGEGGGS